MTEAWEQLVTEEHVRAARYEWMRPAAVILAGVAMIVGFMLYGRAPKSFGGGGQAQQARLSVEEAARLRPYKAFETLPPPTLKETQVREVPPAEELSNVVSMTLQSLDRNDTWSPDIELNKVDKKTFWHTPWPHNKLTVVDAGDVKVMGAIVNTRSGPYSYELKRWFGVFRKTPKGWRARTVVYPEEFISAVDGTEGVYPGDVPVSLGRTFEK